jgi:hypothetical protein
VKEEAEEEEEEEEWTKTSVMSRRMLWSVLQRWICMSPY